MSNSVKIAPEVVTPTTPLRLEIAARLGFPDGSMSTSALRRLVVANNKLTVEIIAGKYYTTLAAIEEMRQSCRVKAKAPISLPTKRGNWTIRRWTIQTWHWMLPCRPRRR